MSGLWEPPPGGGEDLGDEEFLEFLSTGEISLRPRGGDVPASEGSSAAQGSRAAQVSRAAHETLPTRSAADRPTEAPPTQQPEPARSGMAGLFRRNGADRVQGPFVELALLTTAALLLGVLTWDGITSDNIANASADTSGVSGSPGTQTRSPGMRDQGRPQIDDSAPKPKMVKVIATPTPKRMVTTQVPRRPVTPELRVPAVLRAPDVSLWLDAQHAGSLFASSSCTGRAATGVVGCWKDRSGNGLAAVQGDMARKPRLAGGVPSRGISFSGRNYLRFGTRGLPTGGQPATVLMVLRGTASDPAVQNDRVAFFYGADAPGAGRMIGAHGMTRQPFADGRQTVRSFGGGAPLSTARFSLVVAEFSGSGIRTAVDGGGFGPAARARLATGGGDGRLGADVVPRGVYDWRGSIAEVIVIDRPLTAQQKATIGAYLGLKWSIPGLW